MNKDFILSNLREARDELIRMIQEIEATPEYAYGDYAVDMTHLYHHVNTAWNARDASDEQVGECSERDFYRWRQFPPSNEIYLGS